MIWEYLEKSNLSARAGWSRVDPVRVSWPAEPLSIIFEKSWGTWSLRAQEAPQQLVLRCWSASGHPLPSQLRNFVYFPNTGPPRFEGIWSDLKSLGKSLSFSEVGFISADCRSVKVTQWSKLIILSLLSQHKEQQASHTHIYTHIYVQWGKSLAGSAHLLYGAWWEPGSLG